MIIINVIDFNGCLFYIGLLVELWGMEVFFILQLDLILIIVYFDFQIIFISVFGDYDFMIDFVGNKNLFVSKCMDNIVFY